MLEIVEKNEKKFKVMAESFIESISILQNHVENENDKFSIVKNRKYMSYTFLSHIHKILP